MSQTLRADPRAARRITLDEEGMQALVTLGAGDMRRTLNIFQVQSCNIRSVAPDLISDLSLHTVPHRHRARDRGLYILYLSVMETRMETLMLVGDVGTVSLCMGSGSRRDCILWAA